MKPACAEIEREYGPFPDAPWVHGVAVAEGQVWFAAGDHLQAFDPDRGTATRTIPVASDAGTTFDGRHLFQIAGPVIHRIDPSTGDILATIPAPGSKSSGLAWADGSLWVGQYGERAIHRVDPSTGEILRTIHSDRFVTGVAWTEGELWHGTLEDDASELRRVDPDSGAVLEAIAMPPGVVVTGLDANGKGRFYCGGGRSGKIRAVRRGTARVDTP